MSKKYWSQRKGITNKYDFSKLKVAIKSSFYHFYEKGCFQEYYGYDCVDVGFVHGKAGIDISNFIFKKIRRIIEWPLNFDIFDEDTLFDILELFHDTISLPEYIYC